MEDHDMPAPRNIPEELGEKAWRIALSWSLGLGLLSGGLEALIIAARLRLAMGFGDMLILAAVSILCGAALGLGTALLAVPLAHFTGREQAPSLRLSRAFGLSSFLLTAWFAWNDLGALLQGGRWLTLLATLCVPFAIAGTLLFNARHQVRKLEIGWEPRLAFLPSAALLSLSLALLASTWVVVRPSGLQDVSRKGPSNVLIVTIDTLRRDHLGIYGEDQAAPTPTFDAFARSGLLFRDAVTPLPETGPAHATLFTGLHPLRHGVMSNADPLSKGFLTLAEQLQVEGWATAAFVSSFAVDSRTGLDQGFRIYDDDFFPAIRGLSEIRLASLGLRALMRFLDPLDFPFLLERPAPDTISRAVRWLEEQRSGATLTPNPFFCWVHLFEPHAPYESHPGSPGNTDTPAAVEHRQILADEKSFDYTPQVIEALRALYREEVIYADHELGVLLDALDRLGLAKDTLVIITADHGEMLGEHDYLFNHHSIYDEALRVPLAIRAPGRAGLPSEEKRQVRLMDLPVTVLGFLGMQPGRNMEGLDLLDYVAQQDSPPLPATLAGRTTASLSRGSLYGLRTGVSLGGSSVKYIFNEENGREELYNLESDPAEMVDILEEQREIGLKSREWVEGERKTLRGAASGGGGELERLRALGYVE